MIRRIAESLKTRNFSVFATELIIVIVGVFMGIQVSNWNDARMDRIRAHSYLERIRDDLDTDMISYKDRLRFWNEVLAYGVVALDYINTGNREGLTDWDLLLAYFQASQLGEFRTTRNTYDELKSGGELGLILDLELRNRLAGYYRDADNAAISEQSPAYREHLRGLIPLHIQDYIWKNCFSIRDDSQLLVDCESPITQKEAAELIDVFSKNKELLYELRFWMSTMQVSAVMGADRAKSAEQLRNLVHEKVEE